MGKKIRATIKYSLSFLLAVLFIYLAVKDIDFSSFWNGLSQTRWFWIALFLAASVAALIFRALRWRAILRPLDGDTKTVECWRAGNIGNVINLALPGAGEFVRCGCLRSSRRPYDKVFGTIACERSFDVLAIIALIALALAFGWEKFGVFFREQIFSPAASSLDFSLWWLAALASVVIAAAVWASFRFKDSNGICRKAAGTITGIMQGFVSFSKMEHKWLFAFYTAAIWLSYVLMCWFSMKSVPALSGLDITDALFISAIGNLASVIPVPGGIGAYHYLIMISLEALYAIPAETGLLFATLCHESHAILILVLGVVSYITSQLGKNKKND